MTPTQLRAFATVVRLGSVKAAAEDLRVTEAAVSLHVGQLRKELGDQLFSRTGSGLAFTPGGLRLASRAVDTPWSSVGFGGVSQRFPEPLAANSTARPLIGLPCGSTTRTVSSTASWPSALACLADSNTDEPEGSTCGSVGESLDTRPSQATSRLHTRREMQNRITR